MQLAREAAARSPKGLIAFGFFAPAAQAWARTTVLSTFNSLRFPLRFNGIQDHPHVNSQQNLGTTQAVEKALDLIGAGAVVGERETVIDALGVKLGVELIPT